MDQLSGAELAALLKTLNVILSVAGFFGGIAVFALLRMARDINTIKTSIAVQNEQHQQLKEEQRELKLRITKLETAA